MFRQFSSEQEKNILEFLKFIMDLKINTVMINMWNARVTKIIHVTYALENNSMLDALINEVDNTINIEICIYQKTIIQQKLNIKIKPTKLFKKNLSMHINALSRRLQYFLDIEKIYQYKEE